MPVPIGPSIFDVQVSAVDANVPSSVSEPDPIKLTDAPNIKEAPFDGLLMVAVGEVLLIVIDTDAVPVALLLSVTVSVIVCMPTDNVFKEIGDPVPREPSRQ